MTIRSNSSRIIEEHMGSHLLEMSHWSICWISYCYTGVWIAEMIQ